MKIKQLILLGSIAFIVCACTANEAARYTYDYFAKLKEFKKKAADEKAAAEKTVAEKTTAEKTVAEKTTAEKTTVEKTTVEKTAAEKTGAEKTVAANSPEKKTPAVDTIAEVEGVWESSDKHLKYVFESAAEGHYCIDGKACARFTWTLNGKQVIVICDNSTGFKFRVENNNLHGTRGSEELVLSRSRSTGT